MPGIGLAEIAVIFLLLLIVVGPDRLPQVARTMGRAMGEARRVTDELKGALILEGGTPPSPRRSAAPRRAHRARHRTPDLLSKDVESSTIQAPASKEVDV